MKKILLFVLVCVLTANLVYAAEKPGTSREAVALVNKAIAYYKANGRDKAFAAFNNQKGMFVNKDLYIFVIDWNGVILAHGADKSLINKPTANLRDAEGKLFMKAMVETAKIKGKGWVDYKWTNPVTKKIAHKSSYVKRVARENILIGCGVYRTE